MNTIDFKQEWDFVVTQIHREKPSKTNLLKRESLFALQILLSKAEFATSTREFNFLRKNYFALKNLYM